MVLTKHRDEMAIRNTGFKNITYYTAVNGNNKKAFMFFAQFPYTKNRALELYFGYKLLRNDPDQRCMLAVRVKPFKARSEEHTSELQSRFDLVCSLLLEKQKILCTINDVSELNR